MIVRMEAAVRRLARFFSRDEWLARLLNRSHVQGQAAQSGLVLVQIDGLAFTQFEKAVSRGDLPFLASLRTKEGYLTRRMYSGIPSNTPAFQASLFYGVQACVPAFSFRDGRSGNVFNMFNPECAAAVEDRLKEVGTPLLAGGSAYGNIFTGGAAEPHFCAAAMGWRGLLKAANPFGAPITILFNLHILVRALFLMIVEFFLSFFDCLRSILTGKKIVFEIGYIPLRVAVCVVLREINTAGAKIDISRGLPVVQVNFAGYDEQAHHRGPTSSFAHWSLRGIDAAIAGIWKAAQNAPHREYDVFIYSDHGQEDTVYYGDECGRSPADAVNEVFEEKAGPRSAETRASRGAPGWRAHLLRSRPGRDQKKELANTSAPDAPAALQTVVTTLGPIAHIYPSTVLSDAEKERIALALVGKAKVPIVMMPSSPGKAVAWNSSGRFTLPEEADKVIDPQHPFFKEAARDLAELCHHPDAGTLLMFGWRKNGRSITFSREQGGHAGPGTEETSAFALLPMDALTPVFGKTIGVQDLRQACSRVLGRADASSAVERPQEISPVFRVMTYNVHSCLGRDGKVSPQRIARIIARHSPDVVALQELDSYEEMKQAEVIAQKLEMTFQYHSPFAMKKGQRGNAILSRFPMRSIRNTSLPRLRSGRLLEPRGAQWVEIDVHGRKVQVFNTHLSLSPTEGLLQAEALVGGEWIGNPECRGPLILCGDFNAMFRSKICGRLGSAAKNVQLELSGHRPLRTLPSYYPLRSVDHIFTGAGIRILKIEAPKTALEKIASDHLPLIAELELVPGEADPV